MRRKPVGLSEAMTETHFDNGYWYTTDLKVFAARIGVPSASQLRKDEFNRHIVDEGFVGSPDIVVTRMLKADEIVFAEGSVRTQRSDGTRANLVFCDVFEMQDTKIRRLTSYLMEIK